MAEKSIHELSAEELKQLLAEKTAKEAAEKKAERDKYEQDKDLFVKRIFGDAVAYHTILRDFKNELHQEFDKHEEVLANYGGIRGNSKGGFSLTTTDGNHRVRRTRATTPQWDERSKKGEALIIEFLKEQIQDERLHKLVMSFLERNDKGELEYSRVMNLLNMKNEFDDERWLKGLELMQESYSLTLRAYSYEFQHKNSSTGKWERLELNFASI